MIKKTYNPVIRDEAYKTTLFARIPVPRPNSVIVLTAGSDVGRSLCIRTGADVKPSELRKSDYNRLTEIDTGEHYIEIEMSLLSKDNVFSFIVDTSMTAAVSDPVLFLEEGIRDAAARIEAEMKPVLQELAEEYEIEDVRDFRDAVRNEMTHFALAKCGITLRGCAVNVRGDDQYLEYIRKRKKLTHKVQFEEEKAESARKISRFYSDPITSIFSEVADGKITAAQAIEKIRQNRDADFASNLKRAEQAMDLITKWRNDGIVSEEKIQSMIMPLLSEMINGTGITRQISGEETPAITENEDPKVDPAIFAPIDD